LTPTKLVAVRPPMVLLSSLSELGVDPVIDSLRELVGQRLFLVPHLMYLTR
jgi:hypothetical protein